MEKTRSAKRKRKTTTGRTSSPPTPTSIRIRAFRSSSACPPSLIGGLEGSGDMEILFRCRCLLPICMVPPSPLSCRMCGDFRLPSDGEWMLLSVGSTSSPAPVPIHWATTVVRAYPVRSDLPGCRRRSLLQCLRGCLPTETRLTTSRRPPLLVSCWAPCACILRSRRTLPPSTPIVSRSRRARSYLKISKDGCHRKLPRQLFISTRSSKGAPRRSSASWLAKDGRSPTGIQFSGEAPRRGRVSFETSWAKASSECAGGPSASSACSSFVSRARIPFAWSSTPVARTFATIDLRRLGSALPRLSPRSTSIGPPILPRLVGSTRSMLTTPGPTSRTASTSSSAPKSVRGSAFPMSSAPLTSASPRPGATRPAEWSLSRLMTKSMFASRPCLWGGAGPCILPKRLCRRSLLPQTLADLMAFCATAVQPPFLYIGLRFTPSTWTTSRRSPSMPPMPTSRTRPSPRAAPMPALSRMRRWWRHSSWRHWASSWKVVPTPVCGTSRAVSGDSGLLRKSFYGESGCRSRSSRFGWVMQFISVCSAAACCRFSALLFVSATAANLSPASSKSCAARDVAYPRFGLFGAGGSTTTLDDRGYLWRLLRLWLLHGIYRGSGEPSS